MTKGNRDHVDSGFLSQFSGLRARAELSRLWQTRNHLPPDKTHSIWREVRSATAKAASICPVLRSVRRCAVLGFGTLTLGAASAQEKPGQLNRPEGPAPDGMVWIAGGEFSMGAVLNGGGTGE